MKKSISLILLAAMSLLSYGRTPKEYFEAKYGDMLISDDFYDLWEQDYEAGFRAKDSCRLEVKKYVYAEVLPTLEPNSLAYADALFHLADFLREEERRQTLRQVRTIVEAQEGRSKRYLDALQYEAYSWGVDFAINELQSQPADTIDSVCALFDQMLEVCHQLYRPTDSAYLAIVRAYGNLSYYRNHEVDVDPDTQEWYYARASYSTAALLWRDLMRWDSISAEEYSLLIEGEIFPFYVSDRPDEATFRADYMWIASYFASYSPADFVDIAHANEQIIKRIYGEHSEQYLQAAGYYLHALTFTYDSTAVAQRIERAQALCEDILKQQELRQDSIKLYYEWVCNDYQCRLSREGATEALQKELDKAAKAIRKTGDNRLIARIIDLQTKHAQLAGNYARAIQLNKEALKALPALPVEGDKSSEYYPTLALLEPHYRALMQTYVFSGEWEQAYQYCNFFYGIYMDKHFGPFETVDKKDVAAWMKYFGRIYTYADNVFPYLVQLYQQFDRQLYDWSGFTDNSND